MSEQVLYRKYRPKSFKEVLGQDHIVSVLEVATKDGGLAHAYLFSGSRGTGKTSIARILASDIGTSPNDIHEMDAASNRGIDDIRELRESVLTLPLESKYKVYIIDEVHMLTKEAFNALLKTLEEPPKHVIFILATTEKEKLPDTIISRCQNFEFKKPSQAVLKDMIGKVAKKEGYTLAPASSELVALMADGSFRDALGTLQKVIISSNDKKIDLEEVEEITGAPSSKLVNEMIESLGEKNTEKGLQAVGKASARNVDMSVFAKLILQKIRAVLLIRYAPDMKKELGEDFSEEDFEFLEGLAESKGSNISSQTVLAFLRATDNMRFAHMQALPLELAIIELTQKD